MTEEATKLIPKKKSKQDDSTSINAPNKKETLDEKKTTLLMEIRSLKCIIAQTEINMNVTTFNDLLTSEISDEAKTLLKRKFHTIQLTDLESLERSELYAFAGAACKTMQQESGFIFSFQTFNESLYRNEFWIQYVNTNDHKQLGNSKLPIGIFKEEIFNKHIIDSTINVRSFIKELKQHVECYTRRLQQFKELQNYLTSSNHWNCSIESNLEYRRIVVSFIKTGPRGSNGTEIIRLYLIYKSNETMPFKYVIDNDGDDELSTEEENKFKVLFRVFRTYDLKTATMNILSSSESPFFRNVEADVDQIVEIIGHENNDLETSLSRMLSKKSNNAKKMHDKSNANMADEIQSEDNLSIADENSSVDLSDVSEKEESETKTRKYNATSNAVTKKARKLKNKPRKKTITKVDVKTKRNREQLIENVITDSSIRKSKPKTQTAKKTKNLPAKKRIPLKESNKIGADSLIDISNAHATSKNINYPEWVKPQAGRVPLDVNANHDMKTKFNTTQGTTKFKVSCSTPLTGPTVAISNVAPEDISAIIKVDGTKPKQLFTKNRDSRENINTAQGNESDDSNSEESDSDDVEIDNNAVELLNDLKSIMKNKASNSKATTAKKTLRRKKKPLVTKKTKVFKKL